MKTTLTQRFAALFLFLTLTLWSCANQGSPEGGPFDMTPPRLLRATPAPGATGITTKRMRLLFDENIKLSSQQDQIVVSPPQQEPARFVANGHTVTILLSDSLRPGTTYSFYFGDAIQDNNEDNPLEDFSYLVSTGDHIDSMQMAGRVVDALTYEPVEGLLMGAYLAGSFTDSTLHREPFPYVSVTNKQGHFTMRGLPKEAFRLFATKDNDRNYRYSDRSEGLAYLSEKIQTSLRDSIRTDTIRIDSIVRRDTLHRDSLVTYPYTYYYPNDLQLRYAVTPVVRYGIERSSRLDSLVCRLDFLTEVKRLPVVHSLDKPDEAPERLFFASASGRTVDLWLRDNDLIRRDSVRFVLTYAKTDSLGAVVDQTDTLTFLRPRILPANNAKSKKKRDEPVPSLLQLTLTGATGLVALTPEDSLTLRSNRPLTSFPESAIRLEVTSDSVYSPQPFTIVQDSLDRLSYHLLYERKYGATYRAAIDSAAITDIYGAVNDSVRFEQRISPESDLGHLTMTIRGVEKRALVQLLDKSEAVLAQAYAVPMSEVKPTASGEATPVKAPAGEQRMAAPTTPMSAAPPVPRRAKRNKATRPAPVVTQPVPASQPADTTVRDSVVAAPELACQISFRDLKPSDYYVRLIIDEDGDGQFSPGEFPTTAPEPVYYYPEALSVKKSFTTEESWNILAISPFLTKPEALRKTKPDAEKKQRVDKNIEYYKRWGRKKK